jgi:hypothetical protein
MQLDLKCPERPQRYQVWALFMEVFVSPVIRSFSACFLFPYATVV